MLVTPWVFSDFITFSAYGADGGSQGFGDRWRKGIAHPTLSSITSQTVAVLTRMQHIICATAFNSSNLVYTTSPTQVFTRAAYRSNPRCPTVPHGVYDLLKPSQIKIAPFHPQTINARGTVCFLICIVRLLDRHDRSGDYWLWANLKLVSETFQRRVFAPGSR